MYEVIEEKLQRVVLRSFLQSTTALTVDGVFLPGNTVERNTGEESGDVTTAPVCRGSAGILCHQYDWHHPEKLDTQALHGTPF